ncbi:hypothetical protein MLD38_026665 [Melastoma candidum]|uniref:Uncharacterized protein n=1 Tax=Melastoma candidum TaxID=119954 RepID=A0ACB9P4A6_9MYRT|nr:hypothetical protein MLD38_026665 [Melastoma candidum]
MVGADEGRAALERCFELPSAGVAEPGSGPVMKGGGGKYGAFGAVTLEKSKLDMSKSSPSPLRSLLLVVGVVDIGKKISHGGGDGGDDGGDDDDYFDDFDEEDDGDEGGLFRRRMFLEELFDRKFVDAVLK